MRRTAWIVIVAALLGAGELRAQSPLPFSVEVRGGFAIPTGEWTEDDDVEAGTGFGINAQLQVTNLLAVYAGWERYSFGLDTGSDPDLSGLDADATDQGFRAGGQLTLPFSGLGGVTPYLLAGAIYHQLTTSTEGVGASLEIESERTLGFELGGGAALALGEVLTFTPGVRFRSYSADFAGAEDFGAAETTVAHWTLDLGLRFGF